MAESKILVFSDWHGGDNAYGAGPGDRLGWIRSCSGSFARRLTEIIATENAETPDITLNLGDTVDAGCSDANKLSHLTTNFLTVLDAGLAGKILHTLGNHIYRLTDSVNVSWTGVGDKPAITDYFDALDASSSQGARANLFGPDSDAYSYTYTDANGLLYICVCCPWGDHFEQDITYDYLDWLNTQLQAASTAGTPCVIFSHCPMWQNDNSPYSNSMRISDTSWSSLQTIYDNADTLQLAMGGHSHRAHQYMLRNGVWFLDFQGSLSMPNSRIETAGSNAYGLVKIKPQEVWTPYGMKARIEVTGYGYNLSSVKDYDKFIIATA